MFLGSKMIWPGCAIVIATQCCHSSLEHISYEITSDISFDDTVELSRLLKSHVTHIRIVYPDETSDLIVYLINLGFIVCHPSSRCHEVTADFDHRERLRCAAPTAALLTSDIRLISRAQASMSGMRGQFSQLAPFGGFMVDIVAGQDWR